MEFLPISPLSFYNGRENLLIVVAEHIQKEPDVQYGRIFDFLGARYRNFDVFAVNPYQFI